MYNIDLTVDTPVAHTHQLNTYLQNSLCVRTQRLARDETLTDVTGGTRTHPHEHVRPPPRDVYTHITTQLTLTHTNDDVNNVT